MGSEFYFGLSYMVVSAAAMSLWKYLEGHDIVIGARRSRIVIPSLLFLYGAYLVLFTPSQFLVFWWLLPLLALYVAWAIFIAVRGKVRPDKPVVLDERTQAAQNRVHQLADQLRTGQITAEQWKLQMATMRDGPA